MSNGIWKRSSVEKYGWFSLDLSPTWGRISLFMVAMIVLAILLFILYSYLSDDLTPDSFAGYAYAIAGTLFMLLAALGYTRRRSHRRRVGQLNTSLHWHFSFGLVALVLLFLHSFGHFSPRTGAYALYGMVALVISGTFGRIFNRIIPRLIAQDVEHGLTKQQSAAPYRVRGALHREEYYRVILSYWRICHVVLAFVTLGLTLWHLEYAATLLLPTFF